MSIWNAITQPAGEVQIRQVSKVEIVKTHQTTVGEDNPGKITTDPQGRR